MLPERLFDPTDDALLYHYCSPEAFVSIIENRTIRFSDINMLNDAEEGRWGYQVWERAASSLLDPGRPLPEGLASEPVDRSFLDAVDQTFSSIQFSVMSFIAAFSKDGDSLSQWRAYADDGRGYAIGFRSSALRRLPVTLLEVCYDIDQQTEEMREEILAVFLEWLTKDKDTGPWFRTRCAELIMSSIAFKNPAWREEREVRCQHAVPVKMAPDGFRFVPAGGVSEGQDVPPEPVRFQVRSGAIVAYLDLPFDHTRTPIAEIVMGPKCGNAPMNVSFLLGNAGYGAVPLRGAGAAYV
ncbi:MAG: DUF2971 domain-containing protein [Comamonadaceae bacterium]|nr:MAG: DUF2971 domain-containing protein [Comamonadaceae bacterium]